MTTRSEPVRWGLVGTGDISAFIVPDIAATENAMPLAVCSRSAERAGAFADRHHIPEHYGDLDQMLANTDIELVYIGTPHATHHPIAKAALSAGKHVVIEKPMALNGAEVRDLIATATGTKRFLMEAMWMKFNPAFRQLFEILSSERIGRPTSLRAGFGFPLPDDGGSRWDASRSGSTLLDQGIYPVTLAHVLFGEPVAVHAQGNLRHDGLDLEEHFTLEFRDGAFAQCASSMTEFVDPSASISGTRGWIAIPGMFWTSTTMLLHADSWEKMFGAPERVHHEREGKGYVPMLRAVSEAIRSGATQHAIHTAADTVSVFRTLDRIRAGLRDADRG